MKVELSKSSGGAARANFKEIPLKPKPAGCVTIFAGNLSYEIDDDATHEFFKACGAITNIKWLTDRETGDFKGCGFITFESEVGSEAREERPRASICAARVALKSGAGPERETPRGADSRKLGGGEEGGRGDRTRLRERRAGRRTTRVTCHGCWVGVLFADRGDSHSTSCGAILASMVGSETFPCVVCMRVAVFGDGGLARSDDDGTGGGRQGDREARREASRPPAEARLRRGPQAARVVMTL